MVPPNIAVVDRQRRQLRRERRCAVSRRARWSPTHGRTPPRRRPRRCSCWSASAGCGGRGWWCSPRANGSGRCSGSRSNRSWGGSPDLINLQSDKIVIGLLVGARAAGTYQLGSSVAIAIRDGRRDLDLGDDPDRHGLDRERRTRGRSGGSRLHYLPLVLGVSLPIFARRPRSCAPFLFTVWIDAPAHGVVAVLIALNVAYAINIMTGVPSTLSLADGRPGFVSRNSLLMAALNLVLTVALAPFFGLAGVVAGTVDRGELDQRGVRGVVRALVRARRRRRARCDPPVRVAGDRGRGAVRPAGGGDAPSRRRGRLAAAALLAAFSARYGAVYWPLASWLGVLPEQLMLKRMLPRSAAS